MSSQNDTGRLGRVVVKHARDAFVDQAHIDAQWRSLGYTSAPSYAVAVAEYEAFAGALAEAGAELCYLPRDEATGLDSLYPRDAAVFCRRGAILCAMGKPARRTEPVALGRMLDELDVPVCARITGDGLLEGGDVVWLDERTVAVGHGYRSNAAGIRQLRGALTGLVDDFLVVPLPHWRGPADVFHLMSTISPIDERLALVYSPLLPVPFRQHLVDSGFALIEVPDEEFASQGCNALALAPRRVLMPAGNPRTRRRLEAAGVGVVTYPAAEISLKGGGGPTCLTRPLARSHQAAVAHENNIE